MILESVWGIIEPLPACRNLSCQLVTCPVGTAPQGAEGRVDFSGSGGAVQIKAIIWDPVWMWWQQKGTSSLRISRWELGIAGCSGEFYLCSRCTWGKSSRQLLHPPGKLKSSREPNENLSASALGERHPCPEGSAEWASVWQICGLAAVVCCVSALISAGKTSSVRLSCRWRRRVVGPEGAGEWS